MLSKPAASPSGSNGSVQVQDLSFSTERPNLAEYLCAQAYGDGTPRKTATLTIFVDDGAFKASLNDRDNERSLFVSGSGFYDVLDVLEALLLEDDTKVGWRRSKQPEARGKAGKKT